jgi:hypothetical protein
MNDEEIFRIAPYSLDKEKKEKLLTKRLTELTEYHRTHCKEYRDILDSISYENASSYKNLPYLPVRLFKERPLKSISDEEIVKTMTSSGTSGQSVSKIYLDKATSANQQKALVKIVSDFTGSGRMPMIIIDSPSVVKDRKMFSARGAGILGFSIFGAKKIYALKDEMQLDVEGLREFLEMYKGQKILLFGFTFMIWQYFYKELLRLKEQGITFDLSSGILIHGGGWKKLISEAVSREEFHDRLQEVCKLTAIHDYYGMVEQTGCIYMECECGHLHASNFSDVIIRNPKDFSECAIGERGILQVVSTLPESYPGHSLLTEDEGMLLGEDDCPCRRKGKYFKVFGRLKNAEIRGCSDTYAADRSGMAQKQEITFLLGNADILSGMSSLPPMAAFEEEIMSFLNALSKELMRDASAKAFPDVVSFGFWIRKASLHAMQDRFLACDGNIHVGRGMVFHIAPSNVPVNFAYSLAAGLLCGNANVVRVPTKDFPQVTVIIRAWKAVLEQHPKMKPYICLVRYERNSDINDFLSARCDTRVIWGGDATITELRKSPLPPRATEITFADRYSLAVIDSDIYMRLENKDRVASDFYNDTYLTDQNACTSPRVVVWMGNEREAAKKMFWEKLHKLVQDKYSFQPVMAVDKLSQAYLAAMSSETIGAVKIMSHEDNLLIRVEASNLTAELMDYRGNAGFFYEYDCENIMEIRDFCNNTHCQTVGLIGDKEMLRPLLTSGIKGVDRVVSVGHTMDFDLEWDGYQLVERLTRTIVHSR